MKTEEYLQTVLKAHKLDPDGKELKAIRSTREEVETIIREVFPSGTPTIGYGGSKKKDTMVTDSFDLDIVCYFPHDDDSAGKTLEEIYNNLKQCFAESYTVEPKTSALRLKSKEVISVDFHVDLVPGRYTDDSKSDAYLYQSTGDKKYLKTNLEKHISFIRDSGLTDIIRLAKIWKIRNGIQLKTFILELLVVKYAKKSGITPLTTGLTSFMEYLRDHSTTISVEDPANPEGNDLSPKLNDNAKEQLRLFTESTLRLIDQEAWTGVFGITEKVPDEDKESAVFSVASGYKNAPKPWCIIND